MKTTILIVIISTISTLATYGQVLSTEYGSEFVKRIENNYRDNVIVGLPNGRTDGRYNFNGKSAIEKLFFGDFNAKVEFFLDPSFESPSGFRIFKDPTSESYILETKRVVGEDKTNQKEIEAKSALISEKFAEKLYQQTVKAIETFRGFGRPEVICDGYSATFRTVVSDEVWTFTIKNPEGDFKKMSELFEQIITEVETDTFDHAKYIEQLSN